MGRVLMIEHFLPGNPYTYELAKELQKIVDMDLICKRDAGIRSDLKSQINILYPNGVNKLVAPFVYAKSLIELRKRVLDPAYQIIHVQTFKSAKHEMPLYLKKNGNAALVHTVHNVLPHEASEADRKLYKGFYDACDALVTHNETSRKLLMDEFAIPEDKITVIPHGVYGSLPGGSGTRDDGKTRFLMFGMIREYKGVDILLKAIAMIPGEIREKCVFTIAGRQYKSQHNVDYEALAAELGISDSIEFLLKRIPDEEIPRLFGEADVCLFPYRQIYGSGALLMAYTYLKPVIASNVPAFCEETVDGKTGLLFESENPDSLAKALVDFTQKDKQEREQYSSAIRKLVETKYNWKKSAALTARLYQKCAFGKAGRGERYTSEDH